MHRYDGIENRLKFQFLCFVVKDDLSSKGTHRPTRQGKKVENDLRNASLLVYRPMLVEAVGEESHYGQGDQVDPQRMHGGAEPQGWPP